MAEQLESDEITPVHAECILEAAVEMATVDLKVALARCYEILAVAVESGETPMPDDDFLEYVKDLL